MCFTLAVSFASQRGFAGMICGEEGGGGDKISLSGWIVWGLHRANYELWMINDFVTVKIKLGGF